MKNFLGFLIVSGIVGALVASGPVVAQVPKVEPARAAGAVHAHYNVGLRFSRLGNYEQARAQFAEAIRLQPGDPDAYNASAMLMASCPETKFRDGKEAIRFATRACELTKWKNPIYLDTLAAAQAEAGDFDTAVKSQKKTLELLTDERQKADYRSRLVLYQAKQPYRQPSPIKAQFVAPVAANHVAMVQKYSWQARPLVRAELIFVRNVCKLESVQFRGIYQNAEVTIKDAITKFVEAQEQRTVRVPKVIPAVQSPVPGVTTLLRERLTAIMKKDLTPEQFARYQAEAKERDAFESLAGARYLVAALDRDLYLSDAQRQRLIESLTSHWDRTWGLNVEHFLHGSEFYPAGIDPYVTPVLSAAQKKIWRGQQKAGTIGGVIGMLGGFASDSDALDPELSVEKNEPKHEPKAALNESSKALIRTGESQSIILEATASKQ